MRPEATPLGHAMKTSSPMTVGESMTLDDGSIEHSLLVTAGEDWQMMHDIRVLWEIDRCKIT